MERAMSMLRLSITEVHSRHLPTWGELRALFIEWGSRARSRYELSMLNDRELRDIGLTRTDAVNECDKPFWHG
jgi:uncharacterized protein YjiS (DUF1127 family)